MRTSNTQFTFCAAALSFSRLRELNLQLKWLSLFLFALGCNLWAFVFYPVNGNLNAPLRWNVNSGSAHTNVVNPATRAIRYYIASDAYSTAHRDAEIAAVKACFDQWQSVPGANIRFEFAGLISPQGLDVREDHTNVVFWAKNSLSVQSGQMNLSNLRAWTAVSFAADGSILESDIVLNGIQYEWFTDFNNTANQAQFIEAVLLHEVGHFLGLDHTVAGGATVISGANGVSTEAGLSADELAAMRFLYPAANPSSGGISGKVRLNGVPILGAAVTAEDANGNIANATVTRADGAYDLRGLAPGTYGVRVSPLDPASSGTDKLIQGRDVAFEYTDAITSFSATPNRNVPVTAGSIAVEDFTVVAGPPFRITSISIPSTLAGLVSVTRNAVKLFQGQSDYFIGLSGPNLPNDATLGITGDGLTVGPTTFVQGRIAPGLNSLIVPVNISSNATPGLRSFVVTRGSDVAYANGYLEIASPVPDYNFDGLDDRFQRLFWAPWTSTESAPAADPDGDGFSNWFEFKTGTDPTSASSHRLALASISEAGGRVSISWEADAGKRYQLYRRNAFGTQDWEPVGSVVTANRPRITVTDSATEQTRFYRLALQP